MLSEQKYTLVTRGDRYYVNPQDSVAVLPKGKWISGRPNEYKNEGNISQKIEIYLDDALSETFTSHFQDLFEQFEQAGGEATPYHLISEYQGQKKISLKVSPATIFYRYNSSSNELEEIRFEDLPSTFDCFPIVLLSSAWKLSIKDIETFGVTFSCKELVITDSTRKNIKRVREDRGANVASIFKLSKTKKSLNPDT